MKQSTTAVAAVQNVKMQSTRMFRTIETLSTLLNVVVGNCVQVQLGLLVLLVPLVKLGLLEFKVVQDSQALLEALATLEQPVKIV
jgi:hypothetical protein